MKGNRFLRGALLGCLAFLVCYSVFLSQSRIYQVDECQNFYMATVLAAGQSSQFFTSSSLFLFGPLSWLSQTHLRSAEMFAAARLVFLGVFWFNLLLLARIAGGRLLSNHGLTALIGAATLAPLWDYGFEIRHDNLILTGVLLIWWLARAKPLGLPSYILAGAITAALLFVAVKALAYVVPLSLAVLAFPPPGHGRSRGQLSAAWIAGAFLAVAVIRLGYSSSGAWNDYLSTFRGVSTYSTHSTGTGVSGRFWPWDTLARLLVQTPLLLALTTAAVAAVVTDLLRRGRAALSWEGLLPEALLLLGALGALLVNPTPFPYNLVHFVPYAFVFAFKHAGELGKEVRARTKLWPFIVAVLIFVHLVPFGVATRRHLEHPNSRQKELMRLAEDLTDPAKDPVYDAIGMVPTRRSIHFWWYLHSLNLRGMINVPGFRVRDMLAARPAAVFIPSYRTSWLPPEDHDFIRERYLPLADDFWVLGTVLPPGGGTFEIVHPGRYRIVKLKPLELGVSSPQDPEQPLDWAESASSSGTLDGISLTNQPVELSLGLHRIETPTDCQPAVVWVGPSLDDVPRIGPGNHHTLFWNWY